MDACGGSRPAAERTGGGCCRFSALCRISEGGRRFALRRGSGEFTPYANVMLVSGVVF